LSAPCGAVGGGSRTRLPQKAAAKRRVAPAPRDQSAAHRRRLAGDHEGLGEQADGVLSAPCGAVGGGSRTRFPRKLRQNAVSPPHRETKVLPIGGGSLEIMKDLAGKQMGY